MSRRRFLSWVKFFILLSPLPFGGIGRIWTPLFYFLLATVSLLALKEARHEVPILYEKQIKWIGMLFFGFALFQAIPLPRFLLKLLSPHTLEILEELKGGGISFHPLSVVPFETGEFILRLLVMVLFFYVLAHQDLKKIEIFSLLDTLVLSASLQVFFGLLKLSVGNTHFYLFFLETPESPARSLLTGTFENPFHFSFYLGLAFPIAAGMFLARSYFLESETGASPLERMRPLSYDRKRLAVGLMPVGLLGVGIFLTRSRTGMVVLALSIFLVAAAAVYLGRSTASRRKWRIVFATVALLVILMGLQGSRTIFINPETGKISRIARHDNAGEIFSDFPILGTGFGTFSHIYLLYCNENIGPLPHVHNEYLEQLTDGGILGAGLSFVFLAVFLFSMLRMWEIRRHPEIKVVVLAILVSGVGAAFHSAFDFALRIPANGFLLTLIAGLGVKLVTYKRKRMEP